MMLASMTGFARVTAETEPGGLTWEIKTVNSKGLDIRVRVPGGFDAQESEFRTRMAAVLGRGTCNATLTVQRGPRTPDIRVNSALLRALISALAEATPAEARIGPATLDGLLTIRGVVEVGEPSETEGDRALLAASATALLEEALARLQASREAEGRALAGVVAGQLDRIAGLTEAAERAPGRSVEAIRDRLERAIDGLIQQVPALDPNRLHQEALLLAARSDVREELDRLRIHGAAARELVAGGGVVGRRLDFLAQELAREANTLCAKSNDAGLTAIGLDLRNTIEQFREQVQNLE